eukprot:762635-Hanusia_phi.AAC.2
MRELRLTRREQDQPGLFYFLAECVDNGRVHLTPYPPEPNKKGCLWYKQPVEIFSAFTSTFRFEIEVMSFSLLSPDSDGAGDVQGSELDTTHGGGDGIAFVLQNEGLTALGGSGNVHTSCCWPWKMTSSDCRNWEWQRVTDTASPKVIPSCSGPDRDPLCAESFPHFHTVMAVVLLSPLLPTPPLSSPLPSSPRLASPLLSSPLLSSPLFPYCSS